jgi:hypothetical protein
MNNKSILFSLLILTLSLATAIVLSFNHSSSVLNLERKVFTKEVIHKYKNESQNDVIHGIDNWLFYKQELEYASDSMPFSNIQRIADYSKTLKKKGITLFVVPIPNKIDIYPERLTMLPSPYPVQKQRFLFMDALSKAGVHSIDLVPVFEKVKDSVLLFDPYETHWTPEGIYVAAREISVHVDSALDARGIPQVVRFDELDTVMETWGDLQKKLDGGETSARYWLAVNRIRFPDGSFFKDDKNAKVLIIGDSFVDRCRWWNANLGAYLARYLNCPTRTYCSLLANKEGLCTYNNNPIRFPKNGVVVWAFTSRVLKDTLKVPEKKKRNK